MMKSGWVLGAAVAAVIVTLPLAAAGRDGERGWAMGGAQTGPVKRSAVEAAIKDRFAKADTDKDGFLSTAEIQANRKAVRAERRNTRFAALDANKDGSISRDEFDSPPAAGAGKRGMRGGWRGRGAMADGRGKGGVRRDANGDGKISLAEALARPLERFDMADANKDGTLTPEERTAARDKLRSEMRARRGAL